MKKSSRFGGLVLTLLGATVLLISLSQAACLEYARRDLYILIGLAGAEFHFEESLIREVSD